MKRLCLLLLLVAACATEPGPSLVVTPDSVFFGNFGAQPSSQLVLISGSGGARLSWTAATDATWLQLLPPAGITPDTMVAVASATGLPGGSYPATITLTMAAGGGTLKAPTRLEVPSLTGTWSGPIGDGTQSLSFTVLETAGTMTGSGAFTNPKGSFAFGITGGTHSHPLLALSFGSTGFQSAFLNATWLTPTTLAGSLTGSGFMGELVSLTKQ